MTAAPARSSTAWNSASASASDAQWDIDERLIGIEGMLRNCGSKQHFRAAFVLRNLLRSTDLSHIIAAGRSFHRIEVSAQTDLSCRICHRAGASGEGN